MKYLTFLLAVSSLHGHMYIADSASLDTHMNDSEKKDTGVEKLTPEEKSALQKWIDSNHSLNNMTPPPQSSDADIVISQNIASGGYIELSDSSLWKIHPDDTPISQGWISPVTILVQDSNDSTYPYFLVNSVTGSKIRAQRISSLPKMSSPASTSTTPSTSTNVTKPPKAPKTPKPPKTPPK